MIETDIPSIGVALYGNQVAVLREDGSHAVPGEVGEICMRGHNVMLGYTHNQEATEEAFKGGWFHSRDLGYELCEGGHSFFVITGRSKNMVKIMGKAVSLEEMDRALMRAPGVRDVACFSEPYPLLGEAIVAVVVAESPIDPKKLNLVLQEFFEATALPRRYVQAASIPRTITGKLMRAQLAQLHGRGGTVRKDG
jgi:acyl-CoA synthetase (AMP-forming)/AMP-acid ligase II